MADASRHRGVTDKKVWKTDNKGKELYGGGRWHVACYRMRGVKFMHGRPPNPHSCARHRNPADTRLRGGKTPLSPRTWADWIPVTSTGMRRRIVRMLTMARDRCPRASPHPLVTPWFPFGKPDAKALYHLPLFFSVRTCVS